MESKSSNRRQYLAAGILENYFKIFNLYVISEIHKSGFHRVVLPLGGFLWNLLSHWEPLDFAMYLLQSCCWSSLWEKCLGNMGVSHLLQFISVLPEATSWMALLHMNQLIFSLETSLIIRHGMALTNCYLGWTVSFTLFIHFLVWGQWYAI